jgi:hypothetical protein
MPLTLLSQRKLSLTARNTPLALKKVTGAPKKLKTDHACHQKLNPFRETVPF